MIKLKSLISKKILLKENNRNFKLDVINENDNSHISEGNFIYHITKKEHINSIKQKGLIPNVPDEIPNEECAVYFFKSKDDALDGFVNWYAERYDDDEEFLLLTVSDVGLRLFSSPYTFEYICYETVPPENIKKIEEIS
jgi:hypothetical protein